MKRVCLADFDMAVTGGVELVTASLANASLRGVYQVYVSARSTMAAPVRV